MLVIYKGNGELTAEYNGKRFCFSRSSGPKDIPSAVYDYIKSSGTVESTYLHPLEHEASSKDSAEKIDALERENKELKKQNKILSDKLEDLMKTKEDKPRKK